jgi:threonyl-tRNA synthetase
MIHRTVIGTMERFLGNLLEHYAGALPLWLSPVQIWIIPIGSRHEDFAKGIGERFKTSDLRFEIKSENETVSKKIREGEIQKIPYLLVVGDEEMKAESIRVRSKNKDLGLKKKSRIKVGKNFYFMVIRHLSSTICLTFFYHLACKT